MNARKKARANAAPKQAAPLEAQTPFATTAMDFLVVGIGASAGGLAAMKAFLSGIPAGTDPGMAFVLVQHLAPDHKSLLVELIQRATPMPVFEVANGMPVRPNGIYIIPPNCDMALLNGRLQLMEPSAPHGQRRPIDFFFRSLAQDQHERAIGIVLSGSGSDGTLGARAIKSEGGMVIVQHPNSSEFDGMPRSVLAAGLVDYTLPPAEMPAQLIAYAGHPFIRPRTVVTILEAKTKDALQTIFILLRAQTGHDFSQYRPSYYHRRIERRMALHQIPTLGHYVTYLQSTPTEADALFRDLLIGVTQFFRDPEAFQMLESQIIPRLLAQRPAGALIRVWSAGCCTGEEAYSLAILLQEGMETLRRSYTIQIFATDLERLDIATARTGCYPASIATDITPERLARFFTIEPNGSTYRIRKGIRDMVIFSEQNVNQDPPFSKLDLIACRNLLIYFGEELQQRLIPLFHHALNPGGLLWLGTAEGVGKFDSLFATLDSKSKLYQRIDVVYRMEGHLLARDLPATTAIQAALPRGASKTAFPVLLPLRELTEQTLLQQVAPAGALVNRRGDILYLHGRTGQYLEPTAGAVGINNILKMARDGLRSSLTTALHQAVGTHEIARVRGLRVKTNSHFTLVNLTIHPVTGGPAATRESWLYLVTLEDAAPPDPEPGQQAAGSPAGTRDPASEADACLAALQQHVQAQDEELRTIHEELESSSEELKSSNEEMQSVNEELQSTNEELESSKEELQSLNEELTTVNAELQAKMDLALKLNNDMNNLLAGTGIATVFVDPHLCILRFTPAAPELINLLLSDVGRPLGHIVSNLSGYDRLVADVQSVLETLEPKELEVHTTTGKWFTLRILPYRTTDNMIEGAVLNFIDISEIQKTRAALQAANALLRLAVVVRDARDAITVQDLTGRILAWNPGAVRLYGWSEAEALQMNVRDRIPPELHAFCLDKIAHLSQAETLEPYRTQRLTKDGAMVTSWIIASAFLNEAGQVYAIATTERADEPLKHRPNTGGVE
ncbi:MAG: Chemotaxis protein methyltransferase [Nitrospira sp.]|nr:Chemotaxis protein methyltransferase [Nitrospira sp.]